MKHPPKFKIGDLLRSDISDCKYLVLDIRIITKQIVPEFPHYTEEYEYTMLVGDKIWKVDEFNMYHFYRMEQ